MSLSGHSPNILIHLEIDGKQIRLTDILYNSATLFEVAEVPPNTKATLVLAIDGQEEREEVLLDNGIAKSDSMVRFCYLSSTRPNGRHFAI